MENRYKNEIEWRKSTLGMEDSKFSQRKSKNPIANHPSHTQAAKRRMFRKIFGFGIPWTNVKKRTGMHARRPLVVSGVYAVRFWANRNYEQCAWMNESSNTWEEAENSQQPNTPNRTEQKNRWKESNTLKCCSANYRRLLSVSISFTFTHIPDIQTQLHYNYTHTYTHTQITRPSPPTCDFPTIPLQFKSPANILISQTWTAINENAIAHLLSHKTATHHHQHPQTHTHTRHTQYKKNNSHNSHWYS